MKKLDSHRERVTNLVLGQKNMLHLWRNVRSKGSKTFFCVFFLLVCLGCRPNANPLWCHQSSHHVTSCLMKKFVFLFAFLWHFSPHKFTDNHFLESCTYFPLCWRFDTVHGRFTKNKSGSYKGTQLPRADSSPLLGSANFCTIRTSVTRGAASGCGACLTTAV